MSKNLTLRDYKLLYEIVAESVLTSSYKDSWIDRNKDTLIDQHLLAANLLKLIVHSQLRDDSTGNGPHE